MDKSKEAMLGDPDLQKPKGLGEGPLEPTDRWSLRKEGRGWDREPTWWERGSLGLARDYTGCCVNIAFSLLLLTELVLWVKVFLLWRASSQAIYSLAILIPLLLPSLVLPLLAVLHSLTRGRLSYSSSLLLVLPPSPLLLHLLLLHRKLHGEEHHRVSLAARGASLAQALLTSLPLLLLSLVTLVRATVGQQVDLASLHSHLFEHSVQSLAATVSLTNLLLASLRYNERQTGRAVSILVGIPFLFTNISLRLIGFTLLLAYFDTLWVLLLIGLHFCVSALAVQLGAGRTVCGQACRAVLGVERGGQGGAGPGAVGGLLLAIANIVVPAGYNRDRKLGHCCGRSWRLVAVSWLGGLLLHGIVIHHTIMFDVPNVYTGLAPVDLSMLMPKTGLAVHVQGPGALGGVNLQLVLPQTQMKMDAEHPASFALTTSPFQDMVVAIALPLILALLTLPFTLLRVMLLGWNCALSRQPEWAGPEEDGEEARRPGKARNCLTVFCGVTGMMMFTMIMMAVVLVYVLVVVQSNTKPLVRDLS